jgi:hypothetical protein
MSAVPYDDEVLPPPPRPIHRPPIGAGSDPLSDAATHLLSIPLRQVYAVLWRLGLLEVLA